MKKKRCGFEENFFDSPVIPPYYIIFGHTPTGACFGIRKQFRQIRGNDAKSLRLLFGTIGLELTAALLMEKTLDA